MNTKTIQFCRKLFYFKWSFECDEYMNTQTNKLTKVFSFAEYYYFKWSFEPNKKQSDSNMT